MFVRINGFKFIVLSLPQTGRVLDRFSCPGKWGTPLGVMYSESEPSSPLEAMIYYPDFINLCKRTTNIFKPNTTTVDSIIHTGAGN